jgi:hypothetical protein
MPSPRPVSTFMEHEQFENLLRAAHTFFKTRSAIDSTNFDKEEPTTDDMFWNAHKEFFGVKKKA